MPTMPKTMADRQKSLNGVSFSEKMSAPMNTEATVPAPDHVAYATLKGSVRSARGKRVKQSA